MSRLQQILANSEVVKEQFSCGFPHDNRKKYKIGGVVIMNDDPDLSRVEFMKKFCKKISLVMSEKMYEKYRQYNFGKNVKISIIEYHPSLAELHLGNAFEYLRCRSCSWVVYLDDYEILEDRFINEIDNLTTSVQRGRNIAFNVQRKIKDDIYTRNVDKKFLTPACRMFKLEKKYEELDYDQHNNSWFIKGLPQEMNLLSNLRLKIEKPLEDYNENKTPVFKFVENEFELQNTFEEERPTLAMVTMVKNEEANMARCINSIKSIADEIIVVDTGSTDKTVEIAESLGATVIHYPWVNDYAEPRNIGLRSAKSDWIIILDADEFFSEKDLEFIDIIIRNKFYDAYRMHKRSYVDRLNLRNAVARPEDDPYEESKEYVGWIREGVDCLFRNDPRIYYAYNIHEITGRSLAEYHFNVMEVDVPIHHVGRHDMSGKENKYLNMVKVRAEIYPNDGASYYQLGAHHDWMGNSEEALMWFEKSYECTEDTLSLYGLALSLLKVNRVKEAIEKFTELTELEPWQDPAWSNLMECYYQDSDFRMMRETYEKAISLNESNISVRMTHAKIQLRRNIVIDARDILNEVIKINPTNEEAKQILNQISGKE